MTKLSVNINKVATLRNSRGGDIPNVAEAAQNCENFGAQGITVHPRPNERHIKYSDVRELKPLLNIELNVEGYPSSRFIDLVLEIRPEQVTLVPDSPETLTSNAGWNTVKNFSFLEERIQALKSHGIRTSIFIEYKDIFIENAKKAGADRIELYTGNYAKGFLKDPENAIAPYRYAAQIAIKNELGINAGHDLNLDNLAYFANNISGLIEVSIGHALISDALYFSLENTIQMYLCKLEKN